MPLYCALTYRKNDEDAIEHSLHRDGPGEDCKSTRIDDRNCFGLPNGTLYD